MSEIPFSKIGVSRFCQSCGHALRFHRDPNQPGFAIECSVCIKNGENCEGGWVG